MEGAETSIEKFNRLMNIEVSRDPPEKFANRSNFPAEIKRRRTDDDEEEEEIELSLGLSLNGRFGLDPAAKRLKRSSSVSNLISTVDFSDNGSSSGGGGNYQMRGSYAPLARTCSLPVVSDEWRRRKELNSMKSMEARKKRMEKLKSGKVVRDKEAFTENVQPGNGSPADAIGVQATHQSHGSSALSPFQGQMMDGMKTMSESKSSSSLNLPHDDEAEQRSSGRGDNKSLKNALFDMPYVTTRGDMPNSTKVEGFLYRYRKGDDVKIVCVCHGLFLSPAEFVKHGGGGGEDVAQPLKHIVSR
ncbi:ninja-family protein AFP3-like isoform X2 [Andrographis paniculata]|uniref:ninja-family protein AFP3-like isoform X2 n=1 Tax=Andrographis paniculata TaxID=175694 RepID=UPI0021E827F6|nr:ninja-family protein AFP3-like isoform X2 [Andrographis paniculata]